MQYEDEDDWTDEMYQWYEDAETALVHINDTIVQANDLGNTIVEQNDEEAPLPLAFGTIEDDEFREETLANLMNITIYLHLARLQIKAAIDGLRADVPQTWDTLQQATTDGEEMVADFTGILVGLNMHLDNELQRLLHPDPVQVVHGAVIDAHEADPYINDEDPV